MNTQQSPIQPEPEVTGEAAMDTQTGKWLLLVLVDDEGKAREISMGDGEILSQALHEKYHSFVPTGQHNDFFQAGLFDSREKAVGQSLLIQKTLWHQNDDYSIFMLPAHRSYEVALPKDQIEKVMHRVGDAFPLVTIHGPEPDSCWGRFSHPCQGVNGNGSRKLLISICNVLGTTISAVSEITGNENDPVKPAVLLLHEKRLDTEKILGCAGQHDQRQTPKVRL